MKRALIAALLTLAGCDAAFTSAPPVLDRDGQAARLTPSNLPTFFDCLRTTGGAVVSAHRGGPRAGYAENTIEAFEATLAEAPAFIEIDVRQTRDGVLVLLHDENVDRTTTGEGAVRDLTLEQVRALAVIDRSGGRAPGAVPTLRQALEWADGRAVLELDVKRGVPFEDVVREVEQVGAMGRVVFITYSIDGATRLARLAPEAMIYTTISSARELDVLERRGVNLSRVVAWVGSEAPAMSLVRALAARTVETRLGMFGEGRDYARAVRAGAHIVAVDHPADAARALDTADGAHGYAALLCAGAWRGSDGALWISEG